MTNAEKFLKDGVDIKEIANEINEAYLNSYDEEDLVDCIYRWFETKTKPTLTEAERVILMNINKEQYTRIGRKLGGSLYLGYKNSVTIDSTFDDLFEKKLFQFITERRRIFHKRIVRR